jgi:hypothetical protein
MNRLLVILLAASFALTAVAAVAENAVGESRARLAAAWQQAAAAGGAQDGPVASASDFSAAAVGRQRRAKDSGPWAGNFAGGRKHPPAGR